MSTDNADGTPPYDSWRPATDVLASAPADERDRRTAPWYVVGAAVVLVLGLIGGTTYAVGSLSGGGDQPADALPSGALALVSVDLDPPAGQKVDAFRFLRKFPSLRGKVPLDGDVREVVFDAMADQVGWGHVDFDEDVAPWLGKRLAVAVYPPAGGSGAPTPVLALQVTDRADAARGLGVLRRSAAANGHPAGPTGWAFAGDYALIAGSRATARDLADRAARSPLADSSAFASDTERVAAGVALAWVDTAAAGRAMGPGSLVLGPSAGLLGPASGASGRMTLVARFDGPDVFELVGRATGASTAGWATHPVRGMADLPRSSVLALGLADGDELVPKAWAAMQESFGAQGADLDEMAGGLRRELGLTLPDDLATLLGDNLVGALDGSRSDGARSDTLQGGVRVTTDVAKAQDVLDKLAAAARRSGGTLPVVRRESGGDLVVASTPEQAGRLVGDGTLGDSAAFRAALPQLADADAALWIDPVRLGEVLFGGLGRAPVDDELAPVAGVGATVHGEAGDVASYRLRVVTH
jgi:hypothetical protein